ncbi:MAG: tetratricopeptide repeat protein [Anaerolineae bacterium]|nr:tetratricopeptide repeat protein [Gemmatimonadaceae bacterium]
MTGKFLRRVFPCMLAVPLYSASAQTAKPETRSLFGQSLYAQADTSGAVARADSALARHPRDIDTLIAAGAARAVVWRYNDAIALYTRGLKVAPRDARLYRHRGHRYISLRRFKDAIRDLERGRELDSMSYDIAYHLGLAHYMAGDFKAAAREYGRCFAQAKDERALAADTALRRGFKSCATVASNDDDKIGMAEWYYRSLIRAGQKDDAATLLAEITDGMTVSGSGAYYQDLLVSKGLRTEEAVLDSLGSNELQLATASYGLAVRHLVAGDTARARSMFESVSKVGYWPAFGVIGAEVELSRLRAK